MTEWLWLYISYLVFNTLTTVILTHQSLNRYIAPFKHTFRGEMNALIGNLMTLNVFGLIALLCFKNLQHLYIALMIFTVLLNLFLFAISIFDLYYGNAFTKEHINLAKNPAKGISKGLPKEIIKELFVYYRIILFIPFFALLILYMTFGGHHLSGITIGFHHLTIILSMVISILIVVINWFNYEKMYQKNLTIKAVKSTFSMQNFGIYPQYIVELFSFSKPKPKLEHMPKYVKEYMFYNKNKTDYMNTFNHQIYHNQLKMKDVIKSVHIHPNLLKQHDSMSGIFAGKNLVLVQVESMSRFLLDIPLLQHEFPFLRTLLSESVDFKQFYTSVGFGVSSDAEVTTLTGLFPTGYNCLYWDRFDMKQKAYQSTIHLTTLPKYFNQKDYFVEAIHGDYKQFYNREYAYPHIMGFKHFMGLNDFPDLKRVEPKGFIDLFSYEYMKNKHHISPWISDYQLADTVRNQIKHHQKPSFLFPITMMPHTPFEFYPDETKPMISDMKLKELTKKYLRFANYYDGFIKRFFMDENDHIDIDSNTIYLFYGDHGCGIKNGDIEKLFERQLSRLEERRLLQQVVCFLYVPGTKTIQKNGFTLKEGLIKGEQHLVRGHRDIYRTIIEWFDLNHQDAYFGTHLLSDEPTFVLDNRLQDVVMDGMIFSMRNLNQIEPKHKKIQKEWIECIKQYKILNDVIMEKDLQQKLNEMNKR